jgi:hypothetical protein
VALACPIEVELQPIEESEGAHSQPGLAVLHRIDGSKRACQVGICAYRQNVAVTPADLRVSCVGSPIHPGSRGSDSARANMHAGAAAGDSMRAGSQDALPCNFGIIANGACGQIDSKIAGGNHCHHSVAAEGCGKNPDF